MNAAYQCLQFKSVAPLGKIVSVVLNGSYAGVRFQGAGLDISGNGSQSHEVTFVRGFAPVTVKGGGNSVAAGVLTGDFLLRLPLDDFWPSVHLAPYFSRALVVLSSAAVGTDTPSVRPLP